MVKKNSYKEAQKTSQILRLVFIFVAGPMLQDFFRLVERTGNDVNTDEFANPARGNRTRLSGGLYGTNVAANEDCDIAVKEIFLSDQDHVGGLHHGVRSLHSSDKTSRFDHP